MLDIAMNHLPDLALAGALAWGAGIRLYLVAFLFGIAAFMGWWKLPEHLALLSHPLVLGASGFMATVEMFADKIPWLDSVWDGLQTFLRIPAGAAMAAAVFGDSGMAITMAAAILGGSLTATTHLAKSGTRAAANTSPEPFSNIALSLTEDVAVVGGTWLAVNQPLIFIGLLLLFIIAAIVLIRVLIKGFRRLKNGLRTKADEVLGN